LRKIKNKIMKIENKKNVIKFGKYIGKFLNKFIKSPIAKLWDKKVRQPSIIRKREKARLAEIELIKSTFSKTFGNHEEVLSIMRDVNTKQTDNDYMNNQLIKARSELITATNKRPCFYEPEINEIHNDNLNPNNPTLKYIMDKDTENVREIFNSEKRNRLNMERRQDPMKPRFQSVSKEKLDSEEDVSVGELNVIDSYISKERFKNFMGNIGKSKNN